MNTPQIFNFEQNEVRTILVNDEPYFVGKDVASVLGYSNTKDALSRHVDLEDKMGSRITTSGQSRDDNHQRIWFVQFNLKIKTSLCQKI